MLSSRSLQTCIQPSEYCTQNQGSSEKTTLRHSFIILCHSMHNIWRLSLCYIVKGSWSNGLQADRPYWWNCRCTVVVKTGRASSMLISWPSVSCACYDYPVLQGWLHNMSVLSRVRHRTALRSCMPFKYDPLQPIDSTFEWLWMIVDQCDKRYHGKINQALNRQWSYLY